MKKLLLIILVFASCAKYKKVNQPIFVNPIASEDEWAEYEGRWLTNGGIVRLELSLQTGSFGYDANYKLHEFFSDRRATNCISRGGYSTYSGFANKELGLRLHDLSEYKYGAFLRYKPFYDKGAPDEMYFMTRGKEELLPCDDNFKPITTDTRYTLHKRSKLFTVEGYFTFEADSAKFFERNTFEHWKLADLGEFQELKSHYQKLATEKFEGIYLKALAYAVSDSTAERKSALVVKRIIDLNNDPDQEELEAVSISPRKPKAF
ncbi:MAG: hypothetical protein K2U26_04830 [Cyclobacteriaceae bacterium]|nr:hypothetical protein [Cyclobacteriaceae bacterium]